MPLNTDHLIKCIITLEQSLVRLQRTEQASIDYEIFRNAAVKGFELTLETCSKLLRKALKTYMGNPRIVDQLTYKDVLRHAAKHGLIDVAAVQRWFLYRDNRNDTAHDYGVEFAETTLRLLPGFLKDAQALCSILQQQEG